MPEQKNVKEIWNFQDNPIYIYLCIYIYLQIIATSHDLTPNGGLVREIKDTEESQRKNPTPRKDWLLKLGDFSPPPPKKKRSLQGKFYTFHFCHYSPVLLASLVFMVVWIGFTNFDLDRLLPARSGDQDQTIGVNREAGSFVPRDCWRCIFCSFFYVCLKMMDSSWTRNLPAKWLHFWYSGSPHLEMLDCDAAMLQKCIVVGLEKLPPHNSETNIGESKWVFPKIGRKPPK